VTRTGKSRAALGRPRAFDTDKALHGALQVFWRKGYEGASLSDLTKAMGINRPSLYAAFGDKEALFRRVLDYYSEGPARYVFEALSEPTGREVMERLLLNAADMNVGSHHPPGCLLVHGALACGKENESVRQELIARRAASEAAVRQRLARAKAEGDLSADADPADLARYIMAVLHGMSVRAASGASHKELRRIAEMALRGLPNSAKRFKNSRKSQSRRGMAASASVPRTARDRRAAKT
jgi:AcrR family transcriptional regulator